MDHAVRDWGNVPRQAMRDNRVFLRGQHLWQHRRTPARRFFQVLFSFPFWKKQISKLVNERVDLLGWMEWVNSGIKVQFGCCPHATIYPRGWTTRPVRVLAQVLILENEYKQQFIMFLISSTHWWVYVSWWSIFTQEISLPSTIFLGSLPEDLAAEVQYSSILSCNVHHPGNKTIGMTNISS